MVLKWFIVNQWKESKRSSIWQRNVAMNIVIGFFLVIMLLYLLALGLFMDPILRQIFPDDDPVAIFNSGLLYYFMIDLFFRYMMQPLPTFNIESYLHLPIKKSAVVHFVASKTLVNIINYLPWLVIIPFFFRTVLPEHDTWIAVTWLVSVFILIFANNFLATYLKRQLVVKPWITATAGLILVVLAVSDYLGWIQLTHFSSRLFGFIMDHPAMILVVAAWLLLIYSVNYRFLRNRMYPEEVVKRKTYHAVDIPNIRYLESMGLTGELIKLEMKLWLRHKRTKSMLYLLPIFLLYGLFFYPQPEYQKAPGFLIFVGVFMSGGLMMNYLNYAFGYESNYFDGILTRRIDMERYIRAKFTIGITITTICFILTIPYVFFGPEFLLINAMAYLFNIGVLSYALLYTATFNKKRLDLAKGAAFNYQGISAGNWVIVFAAFLVPVIIYAPFGLLGMKYIGLILIGLIGLVGLLFQKPVLMAIKRNFDQRRYVMAEGFREGV